MTGENANGIKIYQEWVKERMKELCEKYDQYDPERCNRADPTCSGFMQCMVCIKDEFKNGKPFFVCSDHSWCNQGTQKILDKCLEESLTSIDWLLHLSKKRYRDHAAHQLYVGTLGWFLLNCLVDPEKQKEQTFREWIFEKGENEEIERGDETDIDVAWWIASLLHDHAYPLAHILQVTPSLPDTETPEENSLLARLWAMVGWKPHGKGDSGSDDVCADKAFEGLYDGGLLQELQDAVRHPEPKDRRKQVRGVLRKHLAPFFPESEWLHQGSESDESEFDKDCYDHGILAAANLASLIPGSEDNPSSKDKVLRAAIRAIAFHNGAECLRMVNARSDPLALLLILCDEWQEWERRTVVDDDAPCESTFIRLDGLTKLPNEQRYRIDPTQLTAVFEYSNADILKETKWDYSIFSHSKKEALKRLCVPDDFPIREVKFRVQIPHTTKFNSSRECPEDTT